MTITLAGLIISPILYALRYSLYDYYLTGSIIRFVEMQNYVDALRDKVSLTADWVNIWSIVVALDGDFAFMLILTVVCCKLR